jgi:LytS/YehU family sensor histidine kinase
MRADSMHHNWLVVFGYYQLLWLVWTASTSLVLRMAERYPPAWPPQVKGTLAHAALCTSLAAAYSAWAAFLLIVLAPFAPFRIPGRSFFSVAASLFYTNSYANVMAYVAIVAVAHALASRQRLAERERDAARLSALLSQAQLEALRRQLEPHFLFNALNGISGLVRTGHNDRAVQMISGLSAFLRDLLRASDAQQTSLAEEMERLNQYVELQRMRFPDRLRFEIDVPGELRGLSVPALLLQPVVENAIEHGIGRRREPGAISIRAGRSLSVVTMTVYNDGPSLAPGWEETATGIGIRNTRARLKHLYGEAATLELRNRASGVEAVIQFPAPAPS